MLTTVLIGFIFIGLVGGEVLRMQFSNIAVTLLDIAVFLTVLVFYGQFIFRHRWPAPKYITGPVLLFIATGVLSLAAAVGRYSLPDLGTSSLYLVRWFMYASLLFVSLDFSTGNVRLLRSFMLIAGILLVVVGYLQYIFYPALRNLYYLGWDEHLNRLFSTFLDPNFMGAFLVLFGFFLLFTLSGCKKYLCLRNGFLVLGLLGTFGAIVLTFSRSALLMLLVMAVCYLLLTQRKRYILAILAAGVILVLALLPFSHSENTNLFRIASSEARLTSASTAVEVFLRNPVLGVGFDAYRYAQLQYGYISLSSPFPSHSGAGTDNSFLFVLATTGVVGAAAFVFMICRLLKSAWVTYRKKHSRIALLFVLSLIGVLFDSLFINSLFYPPIMLWLFTLGGLMNRESL